MATLKLKDINKIYPNGVQAVFDFNLEIKDKEFIAFVGPSGCGKSTTLRMIAGLEEISSGELYIEDKLVNDLAPKDRNIAMVFQSYALYPHMSVYDNMAFGLRLRKTPRAEIDTKVKHAAQILGLTQYLDRKPRALSGGQRQRVALGRAIVRNPKVFLMDEPLSNLDAKLRVQMRGELIKLHKALATTTIYVTHDQIEAMTMATRIVVMKDGNIMQVGTPKDIYDHPNNVFVASFIGTPPMNFIHGVVGKDGHFSADKYKIAVPQGKLDILKANDMIGKEIILGIRPEDIHDDQVVMQAYPGATIKLDVDVSELLGAQTNIHANIGDSRITAAVDARYDIRIGDTIELALDMNKCHFFDPDTEQVLRIDGNIKKINAEKEILLAKQEAERVVEEQKLKKLQETDPKGYRDYIAKKEKEKRAEQRRLEKIENAKKPKKSLTSKLFGLIGKGFSSLKNKITTCKASKAEKKQSTKHQDKVEKKESTKENKDNK